MKEKELIDPLNEDTYDDRVIVHSNVIKSMYSHISDHKWERAFGWKFKFKVRLLWKS